VAAPPRRRHRTVVAVAMGSLDAIEDSRRLLDYGFARLARTPLLSAGTTVGALVWPTGDATAAVAGGAVRGLAAPHRIEVEFRAGSAERPAAGDRVGTAIVSAYGREIGRVGAVAADTVAPAPGASWPERTLGALIGGAARALGRL
jgi:hypothetical protein